MVSQTLVNLIHWLEVKRLKLFLFFEPQTWGQAEAWVTLNQKTDLTYIENYLTQYLQYGLIWKNTLFRDRLLKERMSS
jgi:hypothetical protein